MRTRTCRGFGPSLGVRASVRFLYLARGPIVSMSHCKGSDIWRTFRAGRTEWTEFQGVFEQKECSLSSLSLLLMTARLPLHFLHFSMLEKLFIIFQKFYVFFLCFSFFSFLPFCSSLLLFATVPFCPPFSFVSAALRRRVAARSNNE